MSPLRRVQILRALIRYCGAARDTDAERRWRYEVVTTTTSARFPHQSRLV
jgi:hypothetical protein